MKVSSDVITQMVAEMNQLKYCATSKEMYIKNADLEDFLSQETTSCWCVLGDSQTQRSDCDVYTFAAPFARYPGYVISAARSRDQHVIVIVPTDPRLVRKLVHALHYAAPPKWRQIPPKTSYSGR